MTRMSHENIGDRIFKEVQYDSVYPKSKFLNLVNRSATFDLQSRVGQVGIDLIHESATTPQIVYF